VEEYEVRERLKVLMSAYACEPGRGSEQGVGWNLALHVAPLHDVWVMTRENSRQSIEAALPDGPPPGLRFVYYDLPHWARFWKRGSKGVRVYYYLWQVMSYWSVLRSLNREVQFDVVHHVTFVKYWNPSLLWRLGRPFLWGPVGGGEDIPTGLRGGIGARGAVYEAARGVGRWIGEHDPLVRRTARGATIALATTEESACRMRALGAGDVRVRGESGLSETEQAVLGTASPASGMGGVRFLSLGRILHLKGFQLGLEAFGVANIPGATYRVVGDGPYRRNLERLVRRLAMSDRVEFTGCLPRDRALEELLRSDVLVHPSLHDSGGWVCIEAMAAGKPQVVIDVGGPGYQVTDATGIKVPPGTRGVVIEGLAAALRTLALDTTKRTAMGDAGRALARERFGWDAKARSLSELYVECVARGGLDGAV
jgi:glycosyltransferase involved in cell wall biosynthesis